MVHEQKKVENHWDKAWAEKTGMFKTKMNN